MAKHKLNTVEEAVFDSTCLESATYDHVDKTITVFFVKGGSYQYDISRRTRRELLDAPSKGQFFNADIRDE